LSIADGIGDVLLNLQGFLDMRMKSWVRNLTTRAIAIAPSLVVSIVSGPSGAGKLIVFSSVSK
jgi:Mn2+/Fe2+ NRAMP family transporter